MSQLSDVESLLENLSAEGELSSQGRFTLDPGRSRQKIAQYLQGDGASWAYSWVRSMLSLGAEAGHFQLGRQMLLLSFPFPPSSSGFEAVRRFLQQGHEGEGLSHLRSSLLWIQALLEIFPALQVSLMLEHPDFDSYLCQLGPEGLKGGPIATRAGAAAILLTLRGESAALRSLRVDLAARLPARVAWATAPIQFEGRLLNPVVPEADLLYARYYLGQPTSPALCVPAPARLPAHHYELPADRFSRPRISAPPSLVTHFSLAGQLPQEARWSANSGQPLLHWTQAGQPEQLCLLEGPPLPLAGWGQDWLVPVALFRHPEGFDEFQLTDHGVTLDSETLPLHNAKSFGWRALVARNGVQTDLSGLKAVRTAEIEALVEWLRGEILAIHYDLKTARVNA